MCVIVNFYEVFAPGTFHTDGWIGEIPDGRGIRHYDEFYACCNSSMNLQELQAGENVIPNSGFIEVESDRSCGNQNLPDTENSWNEYRAHTTQILANHGPYKVIIHLKNRAIDGEDIDNEPHKASITDEVYIYSIRDIQVIT